MVERLELVPHIAATRLEFEPSVTEETWINSGPKWDGGNFPELPGDLPRLGFSVIADGLVSANPRFSGVISDGELLYRSTGASKTTPKVVTSNPPLSGFVLENGGSLLFSGNIGQALESGIYVGTPSPHNWYHWLVDTLPAVHLAQYLPGEFDNHPLLLPEEGLVKNDWLEMLTASSGGREIIRLEKERYTRVKSLVWLHGPTAIGPFEASPDKGRFCMEVEALNHFRERVIGLHEPPKIQSHRPERLFLARSPGSLRQYNQDELIEVAQRYGFQPIFQEALPLSESISRVCDAEYLIGPHGAGWAIALFAECAKKALIWTWDEASRENWFYNLLAARKIPFETLFTGPGDNSSDYVVSVEAFEASLQRILQLTPQKH